MAVYKVEVTRILKSSKPFYIEADTEEAAKEDAEAAACQEDDIGGEDRGWIEDVEWETEILYHTPRIGDTVRYSTPKRGEDCFRFIVREISGDNAVIELICGFAVKPTERVRLGDICLASTED